MPSWLNRVIGLRNSGYVEGEPSRRRAVRIHPARLSSLRRGSGERARAAVVARGTSPAHISGRHARTRRHGAKRAGYAGVIWIVAPLKSERSVATARFELRMHELRGRP
jgi:hypothetical protein